MREKNTAILLMHCPDTEGIIAIATDVVKKHRGNVISLDQYVDREENVFFMRLEWDLTNFDINKDKIHDIIDRTFKRYGVVFQLYFSDEKPRMAIFVSKTSHCLYDLLGRYANDEWDVEIPLIVSNHPDMEIVAKRFDIPYHYLPVSKDTKLQQESAVIDLLRKNEINFIVLARYMQILSTNFIEHYRNNIINIHHSFLPAFIGAKPYHAAHARGVKLIGATSHYVTSDLDAGPIIAQNVVSVSHRDTAENLVHKGKDLEKITLSQAVEQHIYHKILPYKNKTIIFG